MRERLIRNVSTSHQRLRFNSSRSAPVVFGIRHDIWSKSRLKVDIQMLNQALRAENIDYVVAPYEADAQLCFLEKEGLVDGIITEDSDLLVFGCKQVCPISLRIHLLGPHTYLNWNAQALISVPRSYSNLTKTGNAFGSIGRNLPR